MHRFIQNTLLLLALNAVAAAAAAAAPEDLLEAVPMDAHVVVSVKSVGELREAAGNSAWGRFLNDPEVADSLSSWAGIFDLLPGGEEAEKLSPFRLYKMVSGGAALFAVIEGREIFGIGLLIEPGEDRGEFDEYLQDFETFMLEQEEIENSTDTYAGEELLVFEPEKTESINPGIILCDAGEILVLCGHSYLESCQEMTQGIIDRLHGDSAGESILENDRFRYARKRAAGAGMLECFIDTASLIAVARSQASVDEASGDDEEGEPEAELAEILGLDGIGSTYIMADIGEGEELLLLAAQRLEGEGALRGFADLAMNGFPSELLGLMPQNAVAAAVTSVDLNGMYNLFLDLLQTADENAYTMYRDVYENGVKQRFGIDPEKEILALLDGRIGSFSVPIPEEEYDSSALGADGGIPQADTYIIGVQDAGQFQSNFERVLRAFGVYVSLKKEDFLGNQIYSIAVPTGGIKLHWAFASDLVAFSLYPTPMRAFVRLLAQEDQPSVLDREDFAPLIETASGACSLSMAETGNYLKMMITVMESMMPLFRPTQPFLTEEGFLEEEEVVADDVPTIPRPELVDKYFKGVTGGIIEVDESEIRIRMICR